MSDVEGQITELRAQIGETARQVQNLAGVVTQVAGLQRDTIRAVATLADSMGRGFERFERALSQTDERLNRLAVAQHDTDERLNILISVVERLIGGNGRGPEGPKPS